MSAISAFGGSRERQDAGLVSLAPTAAKGRMVVADPYAWERAYERPWENLEEDESGMLRVDAGKARRAGQRREIALSRVQRGMLRNVFLLLDMSRAMEASDPAFKPSRASCVAAAAKDFISAFFDANPISALGIIVMRDGVCHTVSELGSNPRKHVSAVIEHCEKRAPGGDWSLQNALEMAHRMLSLVPNYATREALVVHGALASVDSGNIFETMSLMSGAVRVRVSVVSLSGELYIAARMASETGGRVAVPNGQEDLRLALRAHCAPPPRSAADLKLASAEPAVSQMMEMGFPQLVFEEEGMCTCHKILRPRAYVCPRCSARCCEIPTKCAVCALQLVSAPSLARSYHHLFPVPLFVCVPSAHETGRADTEVVVGEEEGVDAGGQGDAMDAVPAGTGRGSRQPLYVHNSDTSCSGCAGGLEGDEPRFVCPHCALAFCTDCDALIHDALHTCPGCAIWGGGAS